MRDDLHIASCLISHIFSLNGQFMKAYSDPGPQRRRNTIWYSAAPVPRKGVAQPIIPPFKSHQSRVYLTDRSMQHDRASEGTTLSVEMPSRRKSRSWLMNILMAPVDLVECVLKKWKSPSDGCMRCVRVTYWTVLIVGGIISAVVTIAPFL
jgi:hypothetical protein